MTIICVDRPEREWEAIPRRLPDDSRLALDTRGVACWIATRTANFRLTVAGLRRHLGIGKDLWKRMRSEFEAAGYLESYMDKDSRGRFRSGLRFHVVPMRGFPVKGLSPVDNCPEVAGQPETVSPDAVEPATGGAPPTRDVNPRNENSRNVKIAQGVFPSARDVYGGVMLPNPDDKTLFQALLGEIEGRMDLIRNAVKEVRKRPGKNMPFLSAVAPLARHFWREEKYSERLDASIRNAGSGSGRN